MEARVTVTAKKLDLVAGVITTLIRGATVVACAYMITAAIQSLSGKVTLAEFGVAFLGDFKLGTVVQTSITISAIIYGMRERKLRLDKTEYLQERIRKYEHLADPSRTSSRITPRGTTRPEDEP